MRARSLRNGLSRAAVAALLVSAGGTAQARTLDDGQLWLVGVASSPFLPGYERVLGWLELQTRFGDDVGDLSQTLARAALGWRVGPRLDLYAGYGRIDTLRDGADDIGENRFWQQALFPIARPLGGSLSGRTRLEQRWDERGDDVGWRLRQFVRYAYRFEGTRWSLVAWDEVFLALNDTDWGARSGFDQNRGFVGAAFHLTEHVRVEAGYMNQFLRRSGPDQDNHVLSLSLLAAR